MITPVLLAGGSGSRLWPLSRNQFPKQFLPFHGHDSMLQTTINRLQGIEVTPPIVVCNEKHRFTVAEYLRLNATQAEGLILEPEGRNSAPAIALSAISALEGGKDPHLLVLPVDHVIKDEEAFRKAVLGAVENSDNGHLVTFGSRPTRPETGYGYIKSSKSMKSNNTFLVEHFVEKPEMEVAKQFVKSANCYWNSGMFLFKASTYLRELELHAPEVLEACKKAFSNVQRDMDFIRIDSKEFHRCPSVSIDFAVMEKTKAAVVMPIDCGWRDIGDWFGFWADFERDANGNASLGDVLSIRTKNSNIHATERLVATIGIEDVTVIDTKDAVLVAKSSEAQNVKELVKLMQLQERSELEHHREVHRPWGKYELLDCGERFQVKRIMVNPNSKLSTQMHHHRAEHWIVVKGTAKVTIGDQSLLLTENQSTYIPVGEVHSLENPGKVTLEVIEVQSGSYLGEDDIVRFQ